MTCFINRICYAKLLKTINVISKLVRALHLSFVFFFYFQFVISIEFTQGVSTILCVQ